jgi:hypothetical protein
MDELQQFQPHVMGILGGLLQYLRGFKRFREYQYHLIAVGLAAFGYVLFNPADFHDWRTFTVKALIGVSGLLVPLWGGTFAASNSAKAGVSAIPITNSK